MYMKSESKLQQEAFIWFSNNYPDLRGLLYHNYNNPPNARTGAMLKSMGLVKGVADMTFLYHGQVFFIELKNEKGYQTPKQKDWQNLVTKHGFKYVIIKNIEDFKCFILSIIKY